MLANATASALSPIPEGAESTPVTQVSRLSSLPESGVAAAVRFSSHAATSVTERIERLRVLGEDPQLSEYIDFVRSRLEVNRRQTNHLKKLYAEQVRHVRGEFAEGEAPIPCWDPEDVESTMGTMDIIRKESEILYEHVGQKLQIVETELGTLQYIVQHRFDSLASMETDDAGHVLRNRPAFSERYVTIAKFMEDKIGTLRRSLSAGLASVNRQIAALSESQHL